MCGNEDLSVCTVFRWGIEFRKWRMSMKGTWLSTWIRSLPKESRRITTPRLRKHSPSLICSQWVPKHLDEDLKMDGMDEWEHAWIIFSIMISFLSWLKHTWYLLPPLRTGYIKDGIITANLSIPINDSFLHENRKSENDVFILVEGSIEFRVYGWRLYGKCKHLLHYVSRSQNTYQREASNGFYLFYDNTLSHLSTVYQDLRTLSFEGPSTIPFISLNYCLATSISAVHYKSSQGPIRKCWWNF